MKKTAVVLIVGLVTLVSGASFFALGTAGGPPPHAAAMFGGPPGPPPGPPPHGGSMFGGGFPGPPPHGGPMFGGPPGPPPYGLMVRSLLAAPPPVIEKLGLTKDQLKEMRLALVAFQNKTRKARSTLMALHDEKDTMLMSGIIDRAKLAKCDEEIVKLAGEVMGEDLKMNRETLALFTPEQVEMMALLPGKSRPGPGPKMKDE
ncbi:MAG: hypothetical protein V1792_23745 [Pseudomonadota bacterium]